MKPKQYQEWLDKLELTQVAAARVLQVDPRTSRKWVLGERPIPGWVEVFLEYVWHTRSTPAFDRLMKKAELT